MQLQFEDAVGERTLSTDRSYLVCGANARSTGPKRRPTPRLLVVFYVHPMCMSSASFWFSKKWHRLYALHPILLRAIDSRTHA